MGPALGPNTSGGPSIMPLIKSLMSRTGAPLIRLYGSKNPKFETALGAAASIMIVLTALTCLKRQHTLASGLQGLVHQVDILLVVTECF